jgi:Mn-dependent DtxR family transcriptional regulator
VRSIDLEQHFYTFREYMNRVDKRLTASMEDYLEMIYRLSNIKGYTRIHELSEALNVQPSAATRMVQKLAAMKLIDYQKYGILELSESGKQTGASLLLRHNIIEKFLRTLGVNDSHILEETEKIEHMISKETLGCISVFMDFLEVNSSFYAEYDLYRKNLPPVG